MYTNHELEVHREQVEKRLKVLHDNRNGYLEFGTDEDIRIMLDCIEVATGLDVPRLKKIFEESIAKVLTPDENGKHLYDDVCDCKVAPREMLLGLLLSGYQPLCYDDICIQKDNPGEWKEFMDRTRWMKRCINHCQPALIAVCKASEVWLMIFEEMRGYWKVHAKTKREFLASMIAGAYGVKFIDLQHMDDGFTDRVRHVMCMIRDVVDTRKAMEKKLHVKTTQGDSDVYYQIRIDMYLFKFDAHPEMAIGEEWFKLEAYILEDYFYLLHGKRDEHHINNVYNELLESERIARTLNKVIKHGPSTPTKELLDDYREWTIYSNKLRKMFADQQQA